ncbi:ATP-binding protein [Ruegeria arenilitoris]|uniref:ATP-binding protein n=1 Tax=Ruegeria arenilitoris TaxID=1173585 RepID=UPI00147F5952|nr:ATP-binding protein [Ruegeria arenilitoris]
MTLFRPSLFLNRLRIEKDGHAVYDEHFHTGVNIINGDNSSGKSSILNFIYFALGGDETDWSDEAKLCTRVLAEVSLNGNIATLSRPISDDARRPMDILSGNMDTALSAPIQNWSRYPYTRGTSSKGKESFSQALFRLLDVPEAAGETTGKLTMHQVLRLHYADQLSPSDSLFMTDETWDRPVIRDAVGRLLCGSEETKVLENKLKIRDLDKELSGLDAELRAIFSTLGQTGESLSTEWVATQKRNLLAELAEVDRKLEEAEEEQLTSSDDEFTLAIQQQAYERLEKAQETVTDLRKKRDSLAFNIADLQSYLRGIQAKLANLRNSQVVQETLGSVVFESCPACLETILETPDHACHLCKTPIQPEKQRDQMVSMINELALQVRDTETIVARKMAELENVNESFGDAKSAWERESRILKEVRSRPTSKSQAKIRALQSRRGYLERRVEEQDKNAAIANKISEISRKKGDISTQLQKLKDENTAFETAVENRIATAYTAISSEVKAFLKRDFPREKEFQQPDSVQFDFGANKISVNGSSYFSASSRAFLKTSFIIGFLMAATKHKFFRHFRLALIDTIEDKGMEDLRSHNLQNLVVERSLEAEVEHQIIFATSKISPMLNSKKYVVGRYYTEAEPTLDFSARTDANKGVWG